MVCETFHLLGSDLELSLNEIMGPNDSDLGPNTGAPKIPTTKRQKKKGRPRQRETTQSSHVDFSAFDSAPRNSLGRRGDSGTRAKLRGRLARLGWPWTLHGFTSLPSLLCLLRFWSNAALGGAIQVEWAEKRPPDRAEPTAGAAHAMVAGSSTPSMSEPPLLPCLRVSD